MQQAKSWSVFVRIFLVAAAAAPAAYADQLFVAIPPCRVLDTRLGGGGFLASPFTVRTYDVAGTTDFSATGADQGGDASCAAIPTTATAVSFIFTAVGPEGPGHLIAWPAGETKPTASTINYSAASSTGGLNIANGVIVPITPGAGSNLDVRAHVSGIHLVADVTGYFIDLDVTEGAGIAVTNPAGPDPTIAIAPAYQLPQTGCGTGEVVTSDGSSGWSCEPASAGTVTGVGEGTGIDVDNTNPAVPAVSIETAYQLPQAGCGTGEVVTSNGSGGWSCEPISGGGGAGAFAKNNIYVNQQGGAAPGAGAFTRTASCNDANDIALSGFCHSTGTDNVVLLSQDALNFNTDASAAQFQCRFRNESSGNGQAGIVCLTVPGP